MKRGGFYSSDAKIKLALTGLLLKGTVSNLFAVLSLNYLVPIVSVVAIALFIFGLIDLLRKTTKLVIVSTLIMALLWMLSIWLFPKNLTYMRDEWSQSFIYCLPFLWLGYFFIKNSVFLDYLLPIARVKLILALLVQIIIVNNPSADIWNNDYMNAANEMMVGLIAVYYLYIRDRKILDLFLAIIGSILILIVGSRGGLVSIVFFWGVWWIMSKRGFVGNTLLFIFLFFIIIFIGPIMKALFFLAEAVGYSTHIAETVEGGGIFDDEHRMNLFLFFIEKIKVSPFGYGVMGDRALTDGLFYKPIYPHNLYLEILTNFGYVVGGIVSLLLTFYLAKFIIKVENKRYSMSILALSSIAFVHLMFSGSYWSEQMFFMLVGTLLAAKYVNKTEYKPQILRDENCYN